MPSDTPVPPPAVMPGQPAESADPFDLVFESSAVGVFVTDADRRFARVNSAFARLCGYDRDDLLGRDFTLVLPAEHRQLAATLHDEVMAGGADCDGEWSV